MSAARTRRARLGHLCPRADTLRLTSGFRAECQPRSSIACPRPSGCSMSLATPRTGPGNTRSSTPVSAHAASSPSTCGCSQEPQTSPKQRTLILLNIAPIVSTSVAPCTFRDRFCPGYLVLRNHSNGSPGPAQYGSVFMMYHARILETGTDVTAIVSVLVSFANDATQLL